MAKNPDASSYPTKVIMSTHRDSPRKSKLALFLELGPVWITSITGLLAVLFGAGFFVGKTTGSPNAQPTVTVTASPSAPSVPVTTSPAGASSLSASPAGSAASADGQLLGSYTVTLPRDGSAPLGSTEPTQAQILAGANYDIIWDYELGGAPLGAGTGDQILGLASGSTPTYQACKTDTLATNSESNNPGTAFCIIETSGMMAGVVVKSVDLAVNPENIVVEVQVWNNSPA